MTTARPLNHGGRLRQAAQRYRIPLEHWLDLSTGIHPQGYLVPSLPPSVWARLPEEGDGLEEAACSYYAADSLLPTAGSQSAIQALPWLRRAGRVGVLSPEYNEHSRAWLAAGHTVTQVPVDALEAGADRFDVLILSHPNNPTGRSFQVDTLLGWHARLAARGGWLVVDEAFMDCSPALSLASHARQQGLIVLRSLGKFFGLAGARLGFALAAPDLLARLQAWLGPWAVSAPARHVGCLALQDREWQAHARAQLPQYSQRLATLLTEYRLPPKGGTALFQWVVTTEAGRLHVNLARRGILTRLFNEPTSLRIGLPRAARDWQRLEEALAAVCG